ncbi:MAG: fumarylacetoacetate hydrolase family protein [Jatrophihabitans sp.]|uniref:fumarylacetoacetate hydrolase family protein n=1 Tax=Jatrophihabitans sp. TaxID=1932789 RepID=UPI003F7E801F
MKLATLRTPSGSHHPAVALDDGESYLLLDVAWRTFTGTEPTHLRTMLSVIDGGDTARSQIEDVLRAAPSEARLDGADARLLPPLPEPRQIRDYGCFPDHFRNARARRDGVPPDAVTLPPIMLERPLYYLVNRLTLAGDGDDIAWPTYSRVRDYELEFACILARGGRDIPASTAEDHIFGFTIFNDFSARDTQAEEIASGLGMSKGKDFDRSNSFGPWIVTADEVGDPYRLDMVARINGEEVSRGNTASMHHRFADLIAFTSTSTTVHPGEILCSGTVATGCGLETGRYLQPGDTIELDVTGIGTLRNTVVS